MFVTDTTDAAYPPEEYDPEAIMDRLAEITSEQRHSNDVNFAFEQSRLGTDVVQTSSTPLLVESYDGSSLRRPRLTSVRTLTSLHQLQPFFSRASIDTFEGVYSIAGTDWEAVEDGLLAEMFDNSD